VGLVQQLVAATHLCVCVCVCAFVCVRMCVCMCVCLFAHACITRGQPDANTCHNRHEQIKQEAAANCATLRSIEHVARKRTHTYLHTQPSTHAASTHQRTHTRCKHTPTHARTLQAHTHTLVYKHLRTHTNKHTHIAGLRWECRG